VRAGMQERASEGARPEGAQEPHSNAQNSDDAYKACNRARVQEGIQYPPPPSSKELQETGNPEDDNLEEVRDLFAQDTAEER
jgi:hypothetical protein